MKYECFPNHMLSQDLTYVNFLFLQRKLSVASQDDSTAVDPSASVTTSEKKKKKKHKADKEAPQESGEAETSEIPTTQEDGEGGEKKEKKKKKKKDKDREKTEEQILERIGTSSGLRNCVAMHFHFTKNRNNWTDSETRWSCQQSGSAQFGISIERERKLSWIC